MVVTTHQDNEIRRYEARQLAIEEIARQIAIAARVTRGGAWQFDDGDLAELVNEAADFARVDGGLVTSGELNEAERALDCVCAQLQTVKQYATDGKWDNETDIDDRLQAVVDHIDDCERFNSDYNAAMSYTPVTFT